MKIPSPSSAGIAGIARITGVTALRLALVLVSPCALTAQDEWVTQGREDTLPATTLSTIRYLLADTTLQKIVRENGLVEKFGSPDEAAAVRQFRQMIDLTEDPAANALDIAVLSDDPGLASTLTNVLADYAGLNAQGRRLQDPPASNEAVTAELKQLEESVDAARLALMQNMKELGIVDLPAPGFAQVHQADAPSDLPPAHLRLKRAYQQRLAVLNFSRKEYLRAPLIPSKPANNASPGIPPPNPDPDRAPAHHIPKNAPESPKLTRFSPGTSPAPPVTTPPPRPPDNLWEPKAILVMVLALLLLFFLFRVRKSPPGPATK